MLPSLGPFELIVILIIILLVFGVGKLPEVGGALGRGIKEFRKASGDVHASRPKDEIESPASAPVRETMKEPEERPATKV